MGQTIGIFKNNGIEFVDAYFKIGRTIKNPDTKLVTFEALIYSSADKSNLITRIENMWLRPVKDIDLDKQCYTRVAELIANLKASIVTTQAAIDAEVDDTEKMILESKLVQLKAYDILQLDGGVSDEVNL